MKRILVLSFMITAMLAAVTVVASQNSENDGVFTVKGEVVKPGDYPVSGSLRLTEALELAGGLTERADLGRVERVRATAPKERRSRVFDLQAIRSEKRLDPEIVAGDVIVVSPGPETEGEFTVKGQVARPGDYPILGSARLTQALDMAGGVTQLADQHRIRRVRGTPEERKEKEFDLFDIRSGRRSDPEVVAGDVITVPTDQWRKQVNVEFRGTPLPEALDALLKDTGVNYSIDPALEQAKVIAKFSNVPLEMAMRQVIAGAGATYHLEQAQGEETGPGTSTVVVEVDNSRAPTNVTGFGNAWAGDRALGAANGSAVTKVVKLAHVNADQVLRLLPRSLGIQVASAGPSGVVLNGGEAAVAEALGVIQSLDTPESLPRPVSIEVKAVVKVVRAGQDAQVELAEVRLRNAQAEFDLARKQNEEGLASAMDVRKAEEALLSAKAQYESAKQQGGTGESSICTQSFGIEGAQIPLEIMAGKPESGEIQLNITLVPVVLDTGKNAQQQAISLTGYGIITGRVPFAFSKQFDVAVSTKPEEETTIAAGSAQIGGNSINFEIKARAKIEEGRVAWPAGWKPSSDDRRAPGYGGGFGTPR